MIVEDFQQMRRTYDADCATVRVLDNYISRVQAGAAPLQDWGLARAERLHNALGQRVELAEFADVVERMR